MIAHPEQDDHRDQIGIVRHRLGHIEERVHRRFDGLALETQIPSASPKITETGAAIRTNDRVCIDGSHWPNRAM